MYVLSARADVDARLIDFNTTLLPLTADLLPLPSTT